MAMAASDFSLLETKEAPLRIYISSLQPTPEGNLEIALCRWWVPRHRGCGWQGSLSCSRGPGLRGVGRARAGPRRFLMVQGLHCGPSMVPSGVGNEAQEVACPFRAPAQGLWANN